jgi:hypothetical protein
MKCHLFYLTFLVFFICFCLFFVFAFSLKKAAKQKLRDSSSYATFICIFWLKRRLSLNIFSADSSNNSTLDPTHFK